MVRVSLFSCHLKLTGAMFHDSMQQYEDPTGVVPRGVWILNLISPNISVIFASARTIHRDQSIMSSQ
jgi:hypothetical protein